MNNAMQATINQFERLESASGNAVDSSSIVTMRQELSRAESAFNEVEQQIREADQQQQRFNRSVQGGTSAASGLLGKIAAVVGAYVSLQSIKSTLNLSDEMANTTARLDLMNDGLQTTAELQQMIYESAKRSYGAYSQTADLVGKLGMNASAAFSSNAETVAFAELLNKQYAIAGTNAEGVTAATLQLTQALGSGVLRGEELNSIFEQAPNIIQTIADYLDVPIGAIREMAAEGEITASIVKQAMFAAADDINDKFNNMPLTFSQVWQSFKNEALWAFRDVLNRLNEIANSEKFQAFVNDVGNALYIISTVTMGALNALATVGSVLYDNFYIIAPILAGVGGALLTFATYLGLVHGAMLVVTAAQWAWNVAMMANPIGLIIAGIVLLIGIIYAAIATINHFAGTSISATGIIAGTFMVLDAFLHNIIASWWNLFASLIEFWANVWTEPTYTIKRLFGNLANTALDMATSMIGSFDSAATNFANLFIGAANKAISAINWVSDAINNLTGIDFGKIGAIEQRHSLVADYSGLKNKVNDWVGEAPVDYWEAPKMQMKNLGEAWDTGYTWGANLFSGGLDFDSMPTTSFDDILSSLEGIQNAADKGAGAGKDTAGSAKKLADNVKMASDDLKYLRDLSDREAINKYTTAEIHVDARSENNINNDMDLDGIIHHFVEKTEEAMQTIAEGV